MNLSDCASSKIGKKKTKIKIQKVVTSDVRGIVDGHLSTANGQTVNRYAGFELLFMNEREDPVCGGTNTGRFVGPA